MRPDPGDEERLAARMADELERLTASGVIPTADFSVRVMAAVADEPLPQPARAFRRALGAGRIGLALAAVRDAARLATVPRVPLSVRAQAFALVLAVTIGSLGVVGGAAVGASTLLRGTPGPLPSPSVPLPSVSPSPSPTPSTSPERASSPDATDTSDPSETPEATETAEPTDEHTAEPTGTDDHGGGSGSGSGSDHGGPESGSDSGGSGPGSDGSHGVETPEPTGTEDHGGSSDG
jgi:uncharacterized membrane protein YgcG